MRILIDMDGVLADFEKTLLETYRLKFPDKPYIRMEEIKSFHAEDDYEKIEAGLKSIIRGICSSKGFYYSLQPISGGSEAVSEMNKLGNEIFICTSPLTEYENCILEKHQWVEKYLGRDWVKKIVMTKDKTIIKGDILIDDKPEIAGIDIPSWEHILYSQPYNKNINKKRLTWDNWKEVLLKTKT